MSDESIKKMLEDNAFMKAELERLNGIILLLKRGKFRSTSERVTEVPPEQLLFNEIEKEASLLPLGEETETITYNRKNGRQTKKPFPEHLPREEKIIDLNGEDKICPHDGTRLGPMAEERTEKLKTIPAQMSILVEI